MTTTLVAVAQSAKARFFRHDGANQGIHEVATLTHPEAALHDGDIVTDSLGAPGGPSAPKRSPSEVEAKRFSREVAEMISRSRQSNTYDQAVVIAAPAFLGQLRHDLSAADKSFITGELAKNLTDHDLRDIEAHLAPFIAVP
jgi:protein required for attachment to host cells